MSVFFSINRFDNRSLTRDFLGSPSVSEKQRETLFPGEAYEIRIRRDRAKLPPINLSSRDIT